MRNARVAFFALVAIVACPLTANADLIEISGDGELAGFWKFTIVEGTFEALADDLVTQVWWDDSAVARLFAGLIGHTEGIDNQLGLGIGPLFVYNDAGRFTAWFKGDSERPAGARGYCCVREGRNYVFAFAERVTVPEPGTLGLFGLALFGIGLARRRKA